MYGYEIGAEIEDLDLVEELLGEDSGSDEVDFLLGQARRGFRRGLPARGRSRGRSRGRAMTRPSQGALAAAIASRKVAEGVLVSEAKPTKGRAAMMGLNSAAAIVAGAAGNAQGQPQRLFRCERFTVPASLAPSFTLTSLNIGVDNQLISVGAVPCESLQEGGVGSNLKLDTAQVNTLITANVVNIGAANLFFRATLFGSVVI